MRIAVPPPILSLIHVYASRWKKLAATTLHAPSVAPMTKTTIDGRSVPIEPGSKTIISFSRGNDDPSEAGRWEFWTLMGPTGATVTRCHEGADPGESFCRMKGQREYKSPWKRSRFADQLHPATLDELESWLNTHPECVPHAKSGELGGAGVSVVKESGRYQVVWDAPWHRLGTPRGIPAGFRRMAR